MMERVLHIQAHPGHAHEQGHVFTITLFSIFTSAENIL